jgi:nitric oxide dioxygenase
MTLNATVLENTFKLVEPRADEFAASFYQTLFADCPAAQPLFADTEMEKQRKKLIMSLVYVVGNLRYPDNLTTKLKDLGAKHVTYGTMSEHYPIVGAALLKTLESYIGSAWTTEVKQAWTDAYEAIANIMVEGAKEYELAQSPSPAIRQKHLQPQPMNL